jgi:hypothetical protein
MVNKGIKQGFYMKNVLKKVLLSVTATVGMAMLVPVSSFAIAAQTDITGVVKNNGSPVVGAKVVVVCNNNSRKDTTDATGTYLVQFPATQCAGGGAALAGGAAFMVIRKKQLGQN